MLKLLDSKFIGYMYLVFSVLGVLIGFSLSILIRVEIGSPFTVIGEYFYYVSVTSHAFVMVFMFLTTLSVGFYYILLPELCFKGGMCSLLLTFLSFSLYLISLIFLILSLLSGEGINSSWTLYTPLSLSSYNNSFSLDLAILSLIIFIISSVISSINIIITVLYSLRCFESLLDVSVLSWSGLLTSILVLFSNPSLICVLLLLLSDRNLNSYYFDTEFGGSPILFQSLFWIWGHPEVYVLVVPVFGIVSEVIFKMNNNVLYNKKGIIFSMISLTILSFLVWGHHMVTVGWDIDIKGFFMVSTVIISIPTGVKVFSWVYTMFLRGSRLNLFTLIINMFIFTFIIGGITGVFLSNYSLDILFHDSYFVVGHFHTIIAGSTVLGFMSGCYLLYDIRFNDNYEKVLCFCLILLFISILELLFSFYIKGLNGIPRRISNYPCEFYMLFYLGSIGGLGAWSFILLLIILIFIRGKLFSLFRFSVFSMLINISFDSLMSLNELKRRLKKEDHRFKYILYNEAKVDIITSLRKYKVQSEGLKIVPNILLSSNIISLITKFLNTKKFFHLISVHFLGYANNNMVLLLEYSSKDLQQSSIFNLYEGRRIILNPNKVDDWGNKLISFDPSLVRATTGYYILDLDVLSNDGFVLKIRRSNIDSRLLFSVNQTPLTKLGHCFVLVSVSSSYYIYNYSFYKITPVKVVSKLSLFDDVIFKGMFNWFINNKFLNSYLEVSNIYFVGYNYKTKLNVYLVEINNISSKNDLLNYFNKDSVIKICISSFRMREVFYIHKIESPFYILLLSKYNDFLLIRDISTSIVKPNTSIVKYTP